MKIREVIIRRIRKIAENRIKEHSLRKMVEMKITHKIYLNKTIAPLLQEVDKDREVYQVFFFSLYFLATKRKK